MLSVDSSSIVGIFDFWNLTLSPSSCKPSCVHRSVITHCLRKKVFDKSVRGYLHCTLWYPTLYTFKAWTVIFSVNFNAAICKRGGRDCNNRKYLTKLFCLNRSANWNELDIFADFLNLSGKFVAHINGALELRLLKIFEISILKYLTFSFNL